MIDKLKEDVKAPLYGMSQNQWDSLTQEARIEILMLAQMDGQEIDDMLTYLYGEEAVDYYRGLFE